ncbi:MAG: capsule assembly Wzi family protein [Tannerellaceae bacterium]|nr:capsule assembly Wzi family protein [Tannerellaceae bacterium]
MNAKHLIFILSAWFPLGSVLAQTGESDRGRWMYQTEMFGSAASGDYTPFWLTSNRYGKVPLKAGNGYLRAGSFYNQDFGDGFQWNAGVDLIVAAPRYRNVYIQQLYAGITYRAFQLDVGSKEQYYSLWDKDLSSGDMVASANARPIPEVKISVPAYTLVPGTGKWLYAKGDFSVGRSFDTDYLAHFANGKQTYIKDVLWHHKSIYFRVESPANRFPLALELGLQHGAQWGGVSTDPLMGVQPRSVTDFIRVAMGMGGGDGASEMDKANVLGNQYGSYDIRLTYKRDDWRLQAYHQRYFEDKSGTIFINGLDGLWGLQMDLPGLPWLQKILVECLDTRDQSGPFHFIAFDHEKYPGVGGGADRYYNNEEYTTGLSYFNRSIGSPLLPSPEYNTDGALGFKNIRVYAWHLGLAGQFSSRLAYRLLFTTMNSWGTPYRPLLNNKAGTTALLEISYSHPRAQGWLFTGSIASDTGSFVEKGVGFGLCISKRGILPTKPRR